jgi:DNA-binding response OmpR family regulator
MKILIVEDEKVLSKTIVAYLTRESYLCEIAPDFKTAMDKTGSFDYDCILLDISLPDGNGLNVLKELKANNKADGVIIISAKNSIDDRISGLDLGADDYLPKPFHLSELSSRIAAVIRRRMFGGSQVLVFKEEVSLNDIIQHFLEQVKPKIEQKRIHVYTKFGEIVLLNSNKALIEILISNLIGNAIKHNYVGGSIIVALTSGTLSVQNSGKYETLDEQKLFQRFQKESTDSNSTGLGLEIVNKICILYNYEITYQFTDKLHSFMLRFKNP